VLSSSVRFVIHWNMSKCVEAYVQEAGRAGRDGELAHCTMYISQEDMKRTRYFAQQLPTPRAGTDGAVTEERKASAKAKLASFEKLVDYCTSVDPPCRQATLSGALGDVLAAGFKCGNCDVCHDKGKVVRLARVFQMASGARGDGGGGLGRGTTRVAVSVSQRYDHTLVDEVDDGSDSDEGQCVDLDPLGESSHQVRRRFVSVLESTLNHCELLCIAPVLARHPTPTHSLLCTFNTHSTHIHTHSHMHLHLHLHIHTHTHTHTHTPASGWGLPVSVGSWRPHTRQEQVPWRHCLWVTQRV
jgi:hypothetical protein